MSHSDLDALRFAPSSLPFAGLQVSRFDLPKPIAETAQVIRNRLAFALRPVRSPMRLFDEAGLIFIRVPKNASNSIMSFLYPGMPPARLPHFSAEFFRRVFPKQFRAYPSFAPLRDPLDRFASAFTYYRETSTKPEERWLMDEEMPFLKTLEDFVLWLNDQPDLDKVRILRWHHFQRQTSYVCDGSGQVIVDLMFPVEEMATGLGVLGRHIGRAPEIGRLNVSKPHRINHLPTSRIAAFYADDIALWEAVRAQKVLTSGRIPTVEVA